MASLQTRYSLLTARERQVFALVAEGLLNKQAASVLGITEVTLQVHRGQVMRKMEADSLASLVRMATALGVFPLEREPVHRSGYPDGARAMNCLHEAGTKGGKLLPFRRSHEIAQV
jgi:DNA-binding CsgD family transcriptional regulator